MLRRDVLLAVSPATAALACGPPAGPVPAAPTAAPRTAAAPSGTATAAPRGLLYVFSNAAPHVTVVDAVTNTVKQTKDVPGIKTWTWNDDNNYFDGKNLWLGARDPSTQDVEVLLLDLDSLEVTRRIPLGKDKRTMYIGKLSKKGRVLVGKDTSAQIAVIDAKSNQVLETKDMPANGGKVCDIDVSTGPDGVERCFYPTDEGDSLVSAEAAGLEVLHTYSYPKDTKPIMLTVSPDGRYVWVQETANGGNTVFDARNLQVVKQFATGKVPVMNTFSPDGKLSYIGHASDTFITVVDAGTFQVIKNIEVGTNAQEVAVHPNGKTIYAIATKENAVAAIETGSWQVKQRIALAESPNGLFFRPIA